MLFILEYELNVDNQLLYFVLCHLKNVVVEIRYVVRYITISIMQIFQQVLIVIHAVTFYWKILAIRDELDAVNIILVCIPILTQNLFVAPLSLSLSLSLCSLSSYNGRYWIMIWCPIMIYFAHNKKCDDLNYNVDYCHRRVMFLQVIIVDW